MANKAVLTGDDKVDYFRDRMKYEMERAALPEGYPAYPIVPGGRFTDPEFDRLEHEHMWNKSWLMVGHMDEIPEPGCYKTWNMTGQPVVVIHSREGEVKAFHNTCRHRGALVAREPRGRATRLVCGYHGWTYDRDGQLVSVQDPKEFAPFDKTCRSLVEIRCERFGKLIFINFDDGAVSLEEHLGPLCDEWQQYDLGNLRLVQHRVWDLDCNWKVAMEGNIENYHVYNIHADMMAPFYVREGTGNITLYQEGHARDVSMCRGKVEWLAENATGEEPPAIETLGKVAQDNLESYNVFPNMLLSSGIPFHVNSPHFWPNGVDKCRMEIYHFGVDWGDGPRPKGWDASIEMHDKIFEQDIVFTKSIWEGMQSPAFDGELLCYLESRIYHWHQSFDRFVGVGNVPEHLRTEPVIGTEWMHPVDIETRRRLFGTEPG